MMALNEAPALPLVLAGLREANVRQIVLVDGNSTDATPDIARGAGCTVIAQEGKGKGMAFRTFLETYPIDPNARYVMLDADATYDPKDVPRLAEKLEEYDIVTGHRATAHLIPNNLTHFFGNKLISLAAFLLFWRWNPDICTGYWAFRGSALKKMRIDATRFDLEADLFAQACKKHLSMGMVDVMYGPRLGERKLRSIDALHIVWRLFFERFSG